MKEVEPWPDRKMIQLLTFDDLFPPLRHSRYTVVLERQCLSRFPAKMTLVHSRADEVLKQSRSQSSSRRIPKVFILAKVNRNKRGEV